MRRFLFVFLCLATVTANSQGIIRGKVTDAENGEELIGAAVVIMGAGNGSATDLDGNYSINNLAPGNYDLICQFISYSADTLKNVSVKDGEVTLVNFQMSSATLQIEEVVVTAKQKRNSANYLLSMQRKAAGVMDGISSQQIARAGDGNAAGAVKRVTGISVEGGKYVYVRGLSDRYSKTTLNKAEIPSLDPERNSVQMDLIPTNLIDNMQVIKSFSPDLPGSFTGGLVDIRTKDFPEQFTFQFSTSLGYNSVTSNQDFLTSEKSSTDFLGFDNGTRAKPSEIDGKQIPFPYTGRDEELSKAGRSLSKEMDVTRGTAPINHSFSASVGNQKPVGKNTLGYIAGLTYSRSYQNKANFQESVWSLVGKTASALNSERAFQGNISEENTTLGFLGNVSYKMGSHNKLGFNLMVNQSGINEVSEKEGQIPSDEVGLMQQSRMLRYLQRNLTTAQLKGEHYLEDFHKVKVEWITSVTKSSMEEPDLRFFTNDYIETDNSGEEEGRIYSISPAIYDQPTRFWRNMDELNFDGKLDVTIPFENYTEKDNKIKVGGAALLMNRSFTASRYELSKTGLQYNGSVGDYLADENFDVSQDEFIYVRDKTEKRNSYDADGSIIAGYAMADMYVTPLVRVITGARVETTTYNVLSKSDTRGSLDNVDVLPALNVAYNFTENQNLRFGYTRTIARPSFREISPFASFNITGRLEVGNPELRRSLIDNFDVRWEKFMNPGEILSVSVFYKRFTDPIERKFSAKAVNELTWENAAEASLYGAEFEIRKSLAVISEKLDKFSMGANFTYVFSQVTVSDEEYQEMLSKRQDNPSQQRKLFGQAPYIVNTYLNYDDHQKGISSNLSFNMEGEKIVVVGRKGEPNIMQKPRPTLDWNISKTFKDRYKVKFGVRNILDAQNEKYSEYMGQEYTVERFATGRNFTVGFSYFIN